MLQNYLYSLLARYTRVHVRPQDKVVHINPANRAFIDQVRSDRVRVFYTGESAVGQVDHDHQVLADWEDLRAWRADYVVINGDLHYQRDIQTFLQTLRKHSAPSARVIVFFYSGLWRPVLRLASRLGLRKKLPEENWISPTDFSSFCGLAGLEVVLQSCRVLIPIPVPFVSDLINRWIAPLPLFRLFTLVHMAVARPKMTQEQEALPSVSVIVPARDEAGNIEAIFERLPHMGPEDELILVEGHSCDGTWSEIQRCAEQYGATRHVKTMQQDGQGKADAVYKGFAAAERDILVILDSDLTVPPEDLPKFYHALVSGHGEFVNGSRLVYPLEKRAMRFLNLLANKFFAVAFSSILGQPVKDTLCGTKVLRRDDWERIQSHRSYFGDFDPFGDFDLLFGANRLGLRIVEVPVRYRARTYGDTSISRWRHGLLLLRMLWFAARKLTFI